MVTYKRRIVYLSDPEWESYTTRAHERGFTISEYIRRVLNGSDIEHLTWSAVKASKTGEPYELKGRPAEPSQFAQHQYSTRPFQPVPKKR